MHEIDTQNKELIVRKKVAAFIEKAFRFCGYDFGHDDYKQIVYAEAGCKTTLESTIKNVYDAYLYLLSNAQNQLTTEILRKFFYLLDGKEPDESLVIRLATKFFKIKNLPALEKAVDFHMYVLSETNGEDNYRNFLLPLMFFNYTLVNCKIPSLRFTLQALKLYKKLVKEMSEKGTPEMYRFFLEQLQQAQFQSKSFYKNAKPLSASQICQRIKSQKTLLQTQYGVQSVLLFGSFAKNLQRLDSDIDLMIVFSQDMSFEMKAKVIEDLSRYYFSLFRRFIDITEISEYLGDWTITQIIQYIKIF